MKDVSDVKPADVASLLSQLRSEAERFSGDAREVALELIQALEQHADAETLHTVRAKSSLKALEVFEPLVPILGRLATMLSNVGM